MKLGEEASSGRTRRTSVDLGNGRVLSVRELDAGDLTQLRVLYENLSDEDRQLRFFSPFHPTDAYLQRWFDKATAGNGRNLGAFVTPAAEHPDSGDPTLVGHALYTRMANGNGEMGIAIALGWRGWLGPFLLDSLSGAAAADGVPNLEADIRLDNHLMLALARRRGMALSGPHDRNTAHVIIATIGTVPCWPPEHSRDAGSRPTRVLVEAADGRSPLLDVLTERGMHVVLCPGPAGRPKGCCPMLAGDRCPLAEGADAIVIEGAWPEVAPLLAARHQQAHPETPVYLRQHPLGPLVPADAAAPDPITAALDQLERLGLRRWVGENPA